MIGNYFGDGENLWGLLMEAETGKDQWIRGDTDSGLG